MGRPPKDDGSKKSAHLSIRISANLRDLLAEARKRPDGEVSLSEEVELRLLESFKKDEDIEKRFGGTGTARLLEILADRILSIEASTTGERWFIDRFTFDQVRSMIDIVLDHFKPDGRRTLPKAMRGYPPSLKNEVENLGRHQAVLALALLQSAAAFPKEREIPALYHKAAIPLGRRLKGSPIDEWEKQEQQRQQAILTTFELLIRKAKPDFSFRRDVDPDRIIKAIVDWERHGGAEQAIAQAKDTEERLQRSRNKGKRK
jgi:hypothetical protein